MKKNIILLFIIASQPVVAQQRLNIEGSTQESRLYKGFRTVFVSAGICYYMGDLRNDYFQNLGLGPDISLGGSYRISKRLSLRSELRFYQTSGSQVGSKKTSNNLSFRTQNPDAYIGLQLDFFRFTQHRRVSPYLFAGVGLTYLSPEAKLDNQWYRLPSFQTEGVAYSRTVGIIPHGIGIAYRIDKEWGIGVELSNNYVFSDYFDDVSNKYVAFADPTSLAAKLADRKPELGLTANEPGLIRGNPNTKDNYIFLNIRIERHLGISKKRIAKATLKCLK